jgi:hypothetical protein
VSALATAWLIASAAAAPPDELFDTLKWIHYDLYDQAPEDQARWEANRYTGQAVRLVLGSVTEQELFSVQEAQLNLRPLPWFSFHFDLRDDNTREVEVARFQGDMLFRLAPGFEVSISGSPDAWKDRGALGLGALFISADRARYLAVRLLDDRPLYNGKNREGGVRESLVFRAQSEGRWARDKLSAWMRADLATPSEIHYPDAPPEGVQAQGEQRSDVETHLRWEGAGAIDLRVTGRRIDRDSVAQLVPSLLRRGFVFARGAALWPLGPRWKIRLTALGAAENARGLQWQFSRHDAGLRAGAVFAPVEALYFEAGYAAALSLQNLDGADSGTWADKSYLQCRWAPSARVHLRLLVSRRIFSGGFFGMNGELGVIF